MCVLSNFNINNTPYYFFFKQRTFFLKKKKKKKKITYYLISRRAALKLYGKRFNLDHFLYFETYKNARKFYKYYYYFTINTGLKVKNEVKETYSFYKVTDLERLQTINFVNAKIYNQNQNISWFFFKYFDTPEKFIRKKETKKFHIVACDTINSNIEHFTFNGNGVPNFFIGNMPDYFRWLYIYTGFSPNIKFKYLHSYNYITKADLKKFSWYNFTKKNKMYKNKLLLLKLKNKNIFLFLYNYLFYTELFNTANILNKQYNQNFNFFYNTVEYLILTNYLDVEDLEYELNIKNTLYYFKNITIYNAEKKKNIYIFFYNKLNVKKYIYKIKIYYLFFFSILNTKLKNISKLKKINDLIYFNKNKVSKKKLKKKWIFIYYYLCLVEFISIFLKCTGTFVANKNIYYSVYKLKISWLLNKKNNDF